MTRKAPKKMPRVTCESGREREKGDVSTRRIVERMQRECKDSDEKVRRGRY
jgi:hypothetical protein